MTAAKALNKDDGVLYHQLASLLKKRITTGDWLPGERIPSIVQLASEYGVAIVTVRQAIALLEKDALLKRKQGRGTYVSQFVREKKWVTLESNWSTMLKKWEGSRARILREEDAIKNPILDGDDGIPAPAYRFLRRVHSVDDAPYAVINIYIDRRIFAHAPDRFEKEMVILIMESMPNVHLARAKQTLTISTADVEVANLLEIPVNSPVGEVRRVITDTGGIVVYVGEATYRGDVVKLERTLAPEH